jgi:hypothetical protein
MLWHGGGEVGRRTNPDLILREPSLAYSRASNPD